MTSAIEAGRTGRLPRASRRKAPHRVEARGALILLSPYILLFLVAAAIPIGYAFWISLQKAPTLVNPQAGFGGLESFVTAVTDYRFFGTFVNIFTVMAIWLPIMIIGIVGLALLVHASPSRFGGAMRFIYYIPGALAGIANFVGSPNGTGHGVRPAITSISLILPSGALMRTMPKPGTS